MRVRVVESMAQTSGTASSFARLASRSLRAFSDSLPPSSASSTSIGSSLSKPPISCSCACPNISSSVSEVLGCRRSCSSGGSLFPHVESAGDRLCKTLEFSNRLLCLGRNNVSQLSATARQLRRALDDVKNQGVLALKESDCHMVSRAVRSDHSSLGKVHGGFSLNMDRPSLISRSHVSGFAASGMRMKAICRVRCTYPTFLEGGSTRGFASGFKAYERRLDIRAKSMRNQARRFWTIIISGTFVAGFIIVVLNTFQENMMFYITPSQALEKYYIDPTKNRFRLGGLVLDGSVHHSKTSGDMEFVVTDLANEILVRYRGAVPDLFREGHSVVAEGFLRPIESYSARPESSTDLSAELAERAKQVGCYFTAVEVLAKHDEKYMPKEVAAAIERNKAAQEAQQLVSLESTGQIPAPVEPPPSAGAGGKRKGVAQTPAKAQKYEIPS